MRLWPQQLIPYLDRQRLLGQHRELCALRGKGWGKKHATVDYVFTYAPDELVAYHKLVMDEMERRGYHPDRTWDDPCWRGTTLGHEEGWSYQQTVDTIYNAALGGEMVYDEHDDTYLAECIALLKEKDAPIDWDAVEKGGITNGTMAR